MRVLDRRRLLLALGAGPIAVAMPAHGQRGRSDAKPRVPAGRDPGGVAVAVIGHGLDYRAPAVLARLARDGEGEAIAWDIAAGDPRPFADGPAALEGAAIAGLVMAEAPASRLVVVRVAPGRQEQVAAALRFASQTPAQIALVAADPGAPIAAPHLAEAARHLANLLIVVPARRVAGALPEAEHRGGLLVVGHRDHPADAAEVVVATEDLSGVAAAGAGPEDLAVTRVASLAARIVAREPVLAGGALKARIVANARRQGGGKPPILENIASLAATP